MTIKVLTRAYHDMSKIWNDIAVDSKTAADKQEESFFSAIRALGAQPGMGHRRADVSDIRYRFWNVGAYMIAYRVQGKQLSVCRIVHSARDFRKLF